ncbi:signal transduction histidine kinase [Rhizomicrobium palustre]|uniref:histidine kinase n=1 Tax=Rhizomicrobium palustre TaxID=189966 RepID=A0A846MUK6_9PROT|nr:ATP-binding protein [Rhizomicrobium palustre]NIK87043.1 signal transduction histidine kinase [Rhizomicrobium palustre]
MLGAGTKAMWRPQNETKSRLVGVGILLSSGFIFLLDMTPLRGAADGASYGLVIAAAAAFGARPMWWSAGLGAALTILAPFLGGEAQRPLPEIISSRVFGLVVIVVVAAMLQRMLGTRSEIAASDRELAAHQEALRKITRLALSSDKSLDQRLEIITEWTAGVMGHPRACVGRIEEGGQGFRFHDIYDQRVNRHLKGTEPPPCIENVYPSLLGNDLVSVAEDVMTAPDFQPGREYFARYNIRAVLHVAAAYRGDVVASLIISSPTPHAWSEREITFAKSVAQVVALIFALDYNQRTLERLDRVSQGIFVLGQDGAVEYANAAARAISPQSTGDVPLLPFVLEPLHAEKDDRAITLAGHDYELYRARLPGGEVLVRVEDVTARNAALAEAKRLEEQVKESAKLQAMGQMAAGIAHDFNNILGAILGLAQNQARLLEKKAAVSEPDNAMERNLTERILGVCKRGKSLTDEILGFARTASVERTPLDLTQLLSTSLDVVPSDSETPATVSLALPKDALPVDGNAAQLLQLVQNLAVNAIHACEGEAGRIVISAGLAEHNELMVLKAHALPPEERILGSIDPTRRYCYVRVSDNGHGIPAEVMDRIFEPFFTTKGRRKGSGLGLVVVHGVVDSHQGCCHVRSLAGQGTVFTIYLPMLTEAAIAAA